MCTVFGGRERKQLDASEGSDVGDPVGVAEDKSSVRGDGNGKEGE